MNERSGKEVFLLPDLLVLLCIFFLLAYAFLCYLAEPWQWVTERIRLINHSETQGVRPLGTVETNGWQTDGVLSFTAVVLVAGRPVDSAHSARLSAVLLNTVTATPSGHRLSPYIGRNSCPHRKYFGDLLSVGDINQESFLWPLWNGTEEAKQMWLSDELSRPARPQSFQDGHSFVWWRLE